MTTMLTISHVAFGRIESIHSTWIISADGTVQWRIGGFKMTSSFSWIAQRDYILKSRADRPNRIDGHSR